MEAPNRPQQNHQGEFKKLKCNSCGEKKEHELKSSWAEENSTRDFLTICREYECKTCSALKVNKTFNHRYHIRVPSEGCSYAFSKTGRLVKHSEIKDNVYTKTEVLKKNWRK